MWTEVVALDAEKFEYEYVCKIALFCFERVCVAVGPFL